jgi:hypothetical protein
MDLNAILQKVSEMARAGVRLTPEGRTAPGWPNAVLDAVAGQLAPAAEVSSAVSKGELPPAGATLETGLNLTQFAPVGKAIAMAKALAGAKGIAPVAASIFGVRSVGGAQPILQAENLLKSGMDPEVVRKALSVYQGPADNMLRGEFSDKGAFVRQLGLDLAQATQTMGKGSANYRLDEILHHPELFQRYPEFADTQVRFIPGTTSSANIHAYEHGQRPYAMSIGSTSWGGAGGTASPEQLLDHILHENTHLTQAAEGFANGGNPPMMYSQKEYNDARDVLKQIERDHHYVTQLDSGVPEKDAFHNTAITFGQPPTGFVTQPTTLSTQDLLAKVDFERQQQQNLVDKMHNAVGPTRAEAYMRLPGETEARMVPIRSNYSQAELQQRSPFSDMDRTLAEQLLGNMGLRGSEMPPR